MPESSNSDIVLAVLTREGWNAVKCTSLSFDGGSLICFKDEGMSKVVAAFSPQGWLQCDWRPLGEIPI